MAHAIMADEVLKRSLTIEVYSAGILDFSQEPPLIETTRTCEQHHTPAPKRRPTFAAELPLKSIDRFLVMEQRHAIALRDEFGVEADRIALLGNYDPKRRGAEIDDPFFSYSDEIYSKCYLLIRDCVFEYLEQTAVGIG